MSNYRRLISNGLIFLWAYGFLSSTDLLQLICILELRNPSWLEFCFNVREIIHDSVVAANPFPFLEFYSILFALASHHEDQKTARKINKCNCCLKFKYLVETNYTSYHSQVEQSISKKKRLKWTDLSLFDTKLWIYSSSYMYIIFSIYCQLVAIFILLSTVPAQFCQLRSENSRMAATER